MWGVNFNMVAWTVCVGTVKSTLLPSAASEMSSQSFRKQYTFQKRYQLPGKRFCPGRDSAWANSGSHCFYVFSCKWSKLNEWCHLGKGKEWKVQGKIRRAGWIPTLNRCEPNPLNILRYNKIFLSCQWESELLCSCIYFLSNTDYLGCDQSHGCK